MLLDGGFSRKACFWDFVRHLDRLDAVLMTRLNNSNIGGISSLLRRKRKDAVYPHIGHFFCNIQDTKNTSSPGGDKDGDALLIDLMNEGQKIISNLHHLNLNPQECYRDQEPINLYHKVGHGTLNMYVLNPAKDSKEVKEFLQKWNQSDQKIFSKQNRDFNFPIQNLISIAVLIIWQPANISDTVTRLLYPGSTPQQKIFESLEKIKDIEFTKYPVCSEKFLYSKFVITKATKIDKGLIKEKAVESKEKMAINNIVNTLPGENKTKRSAEYDKSKKNKVENTSNQRKTAIEKKDSPFTTPKKSMDQEGPKKSVFGTPAKSTKDANNRRVIENKTKLLKSVESRTNLEKRDISKKSIKSPKSPTKRVMKVRQKIDSTFKKGKTEKDCTTDSSTVSTPTDHDSLRKDILNANSEDVQPLKAQELTDLDEEQEAVKEIEAVFRKGEVPPAVRDMRKIKTVSMDQDKSEKEDYLIIEKEVIDLLNENETKENEFQKLTRVNEKSEKPIINIAQNLPSPQKEVKKTVAKLEIVESELSNIKKSDRDVEIKEIPESHADEKMSGNIKSGDTTTAPTLPEDERIPLEDIKEDNAYHIEEKYGKEKTKEKDVPVIQLPSFEAVTMSPGVVGIHLDKQNHVRDIVKTPDEVADLPVHEEVDYEFAHDTKIATKMNVRGENKEDGIQVQPENNEEMENGEPYILKSEKIENKLDKSLDENILSCENINNISTVDEGQQYLIKEVFEKADEEVMETKLTPTEQNKEETHISKSKKEMNKELCGTENKLLFKATEDNKKANIIEENGESRQNYDFNEEKIILNQSNHDFKGSKDDLPGCMDLDNKANLIDLKDNTEISLMLMESKDSNTSTNKQCEESQDTSTLLKMESTEGQNEQGEYKSEHKTQHAVITTDKETFESHASKTSDIVFDCKNKEPIQSTESEMKLIKNREEDVIKIVATVAEVLKSEAPLEEFEKKLPLTFDSSQTSFTTQLRETHITTMGKSDEIENEATTLSFPENVFRKILDNDEKDGSCEINNILKINENMKGIDEKEKQGTGTISTEDRREELEIFPTGGTTFSKSSESSGRSSPEKSQESKKSSMVDTISDTINTVKHVTELHLGSANNVENEIPGILGDKCSERQKPRTKLDSIEKKVLEHSQRNAEDAGRILPLYRADIVDNVKDVATISNLSPKDFLSDANKLNKEEKQSVNYDDISTNIEQFVTEKSQVKEMYKDNLETQERVDVEDTLNDSFSRLLIERDHDPMVSKKCIFQADTETIKEQTIRKHSYIDKKEAELISPSYELVDDKNSTDMPNKQIDGNISTIVGQVTTNKVQIISKSEVSLNTKDTEKENSNFPKEKMPHDCKLKDNEIDVKSCDDKYVITEKPINNEDLASLDSSQKFKNESKNSFDPIVTLGISDKSKNVELDPVIIPSEKSEKSSKDEGVAEMKSNKNCFERGNTIDQTTMPLNVDESGYRITKYSEKSETIKEKYLKNEDLHLTDVNEGQNNKLQNCPSDDKNEKKYVDESIIQKKLQPESEIDVKIPSEKSEKSSKDEGVAEMKSNKNCFEKDVLDKGNTIDQTTTQLNVDESGDIITKYSEKSETIIEKYLKNEDLNLADVNESQNNKLKNCPSQDKNEKKYIDESIIQKNLKPESETDVYFSDENINELQVQIFPLEDKKGIGNVSQCSQSQLEIKNGGVIEKQNTLELEIDVQEKKKPECLQTHLEKKVCQKDNSQKYIVEKSTKQYENEEDGIDRDTSEPIKFKTEKSYENECKEYQIDNETDAKTFISTISKPIGNEELLNKNKHKIVTSATALAKTHPSGIDIKAPCKLEDENCISSGIKKKYENICSTPNEIGVMNYEQRMQESSYGFLSNNATELLDKSQISSICLYEITKAKYISPRNPCIENIIDKNFKEKKEIERDRNVTNTDTTEINLNDDLKDQIQIEAWSSLEEKKSLSDDTKFCKTFLYEKTIAIYRNPNVHQSEKYAEVLSVWSKPLGLPSPAPANDNNKSTPKKERKLLLNVTTKNKWNDEKKKSEASSKSKNKKTCPIYVDLTYVPHHGNSYYSYIDFFKTVRARYYVFSGIEPSREVYNALLEAKQTWDDKELEVTIIPTYDTDVLGYWVAENEELLAKYKIDLSPSASRCTINLQDHETSCSAYRLEF